MHVVVQASPITWYGAVDTCLYNYGGAPGLLILLRRLISLNPESIRVAAPSFSSKSHILDRLIEPFKDKVKIIYGSDDNVIERIMLAVADLGDSEYFLRISGCFHGANLEFLWQAGHDAANQNLSGIYFPWDFPLTVAGGECYLTQALRTISSIANSRADDRLYPFPRLLLPEIKNARQLELQEIPEIDESSLKKVRDRYRADGLERSWEVQETLSFTNADSLSFHYRFFSQFLHKNCSVCDFACGNGYGAAQFAKISGRVVGVDLSEAAIEEGRQKYAADNLDLVVGDILSGLRNLPDFDVISAFEIIEHVDPHALLSSIKRKLRPKGTLLLSTPQNCIGFVPIVTVHQYEYGLEELQKLIGQYFSIESVWGIKAGTYIDPYDPRGSNTMIMAINE
jgi:SAM-dependent methyltransferase